MRYFSMILPALGLLLFAGCSEDVDSTAVGESGSAARIAIVGGDTVDWGKVGGSELSRAVRIVNTGGSPLNIIDVKPSCGCTTAPLDKNTLEPGDTATIDVKMDVAGRVGPQQKTLQIQTNDSINPVKTVYLVADVQRDIVAEPAFFMIDGVAPGSVGRDTVFLKNTGSKAITLNSPSVEGNALVAIEFDMKSSRTLAPGDSTAVAIKAIPGGEGMSQAMALFKSDSDLSPEVHVPITINAVGPTGVAGVN